MLDTVERGVIFAQEHASEERGRQREIPPHAHVLISAHHENPSRDGQQGVVHMFGQRVFGDALAQNGRIEVDRHRHQRHQQANQREFRDHHAQRRQHAAGSCWFRCGGVVIWHEEGLA
ncbi:hypothetical protein FCK22_03110 [Sulfitobacter sp. 15WGC]|nr:hypothetical protein FCK22_03110 [Sulfitobacter sp. 15WGC]